MRIKTANSFPVFQGSGVGDHYVEVMATNRGRAATTVESWGIELPATNETAIPATQAPWSTSLPHRLEPHSNATFYVLADEVRSIVAQKRTTFRDLRPFVRLSTGQKVYGRGVPLS
ncbi:hypothetical protein [Amycolatopsis alkalitolerans]|uniref:Uncharacterized protein n=1 Tax=Amycolatopsis alkalitolerans TaxID=2547244 RepID=A0A5C4LZH4_9PSEU|nr:hypothetical protein [Amycolatopsis alkalitolerans]TNC23784.1 hypothetical protein FG385_20750 [Amycolatopsis alkalitolerans]